MLGVFYILTGGLSTLVCINALPNTRGNCTNVTPSNFQTLFLQNCRNYGSGTEERCNLAYSGFLGAFSNRSSATLDEANYSPYFNLFPVNAEENQSLFWSGTMTLVEVLSMMSSMGVNVVSSANTPASNIVSDIGAMCWCSDSGIDGLITDKVCPNNAATTLFWEQYSKLFAQAAKGTVFYLADGESAKPYNPSAFFGCVELVNLNMSVVKRLVALNIHRKNEGESCDTSTLKILKQNATDRGLEYSCYDLYGEAKNTAQREPITMCARMVIDNVQKGTETSNFQIDCTSGKSCLMVSLVVIFLSLLVSSASML